MVDERVIRIGSRMPSIRKFAQDYYVSRSTVVQAYDRLVAMGYLHSRLGSGFYVSNRPSGQTSQDSTYQLDGTTDVVWLLRKSLEDRSNKTMPGAWWLPASWMEESGIKKSLRTLSLKEGEFLTAYGTSAWLPSVARTASKQTVQYRYCCRDFPSDTHQRSDTCIGLGNSISNSSG